MKSLNGPAVLCFFVLVSVLAIHAQERKIKRDRLPAAVEKTVAAQSLGATINGFSTEVEKGQKLYEMSLTINGHHKDILIDKDGNIVEVEEEVSMDSLPATVQESLRRAAGRKTISRVESLTKRQKLVAYEAQIKTGTKRSEIQVGPNGEKLRHPE